MLLLIEKIINRDAIRISLLGLRWFVLLPAFYGLTSVQLLAMQGQKNSLFAVEKMLQLGGIHTVKASDKRALSYVYNKVSDDELEQFFLGKSFFTIPWVEAPSVTTARDGLGPLYNANTCVSCHPGNGAGFALNKNGGIHRSMVFRISKQKDRLSDNEIKQGFAADPNYGAQLNINAIPGVAYEGTPRVIYTSEKIHYPDGSSIELRKPDYYFENLNYGAIDKDTVFSPRVALPLIGLGEIEKIPAESILANEDIADHDGDGISGKANKVYSITSQQWQLGRFNRKASSPDIKQQVAQAMHHDMGLTTPLIDHENCAKTQIDCLNAYKSNTIDVPMKRLDAVTFFVSHLQIPAQRLSEEQSASEILRGARLFEQAGCAKCHIPSFKTEDDNTIYPFSDFLLHDMGDALSDQRHEYLAQPGEWRTAPLWGIGLAKTISKQATYLHDGRARTLEEAILWHGGEAQTSLLKFKQLNREERQQIIEFLRSL